MTFISLSTLVAAQDVDPAQIITVLAVMFGMVFVMLCGLFSMFQKFYRIPPPGYSLLRSGHGGLTVAIGSGMFVIPILHCSERFPLAPLRIDLRESKLDSEPAKARQLPNIFQVAVDQDREMTLFAAQKVGVAYGQNLSLFEDTILAEYERVLAKESEDASQDSPANRFIEGVEQALNALGFTIIACRRQ